MNNEPGSNTSNTQSSSDNQQSRRDDRSSYREPQGGLDDTIESVVHGGWPGSPTSDDESGLGGVQERVGRQAETANVSGIGRRFGNIVSNLSTNPAGINAQPSTSGVTQTTLAQATNTTAPPTVQTTPRTSTPNDPTTMLNSVDTLISQLDRMSITDTSIRPPDYLPTNDQMQRIHRMELLDQRQQAETAQQLHNIVKIMLQRQPDAATLTPLCQALERQAQVATQAAYEKASSIQKARKVVNYYKSPIQKPIYRLAPDDYRKSFHRTSPREIVSVTGTFDPNVPNNDFQHVWSKLIGYGQANFFTEQEYKDALRYILLGDAFDTFLSFEQTDQTFDYMIEYFGQVYMKRRSRDADRQAVDQFVRLKDEPLEVCMHRSQVAIDRLRHLHREVEWPEARKAMRRNILTQVITDETRKYIQMEEDETLETMGYTYDLETLISMASKYEKVHNKAPKKDLQTVFQVASGGLLEDPQKLKNELQHLKRETMTDKNLLREIVTELIANPVTPRRFSSSDSRESRRTDRDDNRRVLRRDNFSMNRKMEVDPPTVEPQKVTSSEPRKGVYEKRVEFPPRSPTRLSSSTTPSPVPETRARSPSPFNRERPLDNRDRSQSPYEGRRRLLEKERIDALNRRNLIQETRFRRDPSPSDYRSRRDQSPRDYRPSRDPSPRDYGPRRDPDPRDYGRDRQRAFSQERRREYSRDRDEFDRRRNVEYDRNRSQRIRDYRSLSRENRGGRDSRSGRYPSEQRYRSNDRNDQRIRPGENREKNENQNFQGRRSDNSSKPYSSQNPNSKNVYVTINGVEYKKLSNQKN